MNDLALDALQQARKDGRGALDEPSAKLVVRSSGIRVPKSVTVSACEDVAAAVAGLTPPFVIKVIATDVVHKSDVGGVRLNIFSAEDAATSTRELRSVLATHGITPDGWLVEEMASPGVEVVIGGVQDPEFGPMVMVGLGGIFVEVLKDVAFRICPIDELDAREMIAELKGAAILRGARGRAAVSIDSIVDALLRVGGKDGLFQRYSDQIAEIDVNPLIVSAHSAVAVDARIILRSTR